MPLVILAAFLFYTTGYGAGDGNRTHVSSLGSSHSTIEQHPLKSKRSINKNRN